MSWEDRFTSWAKGPATTEQEKCENAETAIKKAVAAHKKLSAMDITVLAQGSYRNKTNVRQDSDVDICVRLNSTYFTDYPEGKTDQDFGNITGSITFAEYRNLVGEALADYFAPDPVMRGDKAFNVHENSYRIDADVVAALEHRRYTGKTDLSGKHLYHSGIGFISDLGKRITNWPIQNYTNGLQKHENTGRRFRKMIRILKRLRNEMREEKIASAESIASCLIEALVWNVPNGSFGNNTYTQDVREVLAHTFNSTLKVEDCNEWGEVNELQYLFRGGQPWTYGQAHLFLSDAWNYLEFK